MKIYIILKYLFLIPGLLRKFKISENEWSSLGEEANGGGGGNTCQVPAPVNTNNNEVTNNLHLLAASAGLEDAGAGDSDSNPATGTPKKRRRRSSDAGGSGPIKMQTDVVRVPGLSSDLQQQITKFDSSEFDVSTKKIFFIAKLTAGPGAWNNMLSFSPDSYQFLYHAI